MTSLSDTRTDDLPCTVPVFNDVMIDIETLSLHKHKALILSIGMIEFDPKPIEGLVIGARTLIIPAFIPQLLLGRRIDTSTQKFWNDQPLAAHEHWSVPLQTGSMSVSQLPAVIDWVRDFCKGKDRVWANGTQFDLCNLEGLAEDIGQKDLWHYQAPRDMRTFVKMTPATRLVPIGDALDIPGVPHEPIYDCISQAWQVWAHYAEI